MNYINNFQVIHEYSRKQAIADGFLIDLTDNALEAGIKWSLAVTSEVWDKYLVWTNEDDARQIYQDQSGRIWDMLSMLRMSIRSSKASDNWIYFKFYCIPRGGKGIRLKQTMLKAKVSAGDNLEPVFTIMMPHEE